MSSTKKHYKGYTLLEVLIYVLILGVIVGVLGGIILLLYRYKTTIEDRVNVNEDMRVLVKSIRDDMYLGSAVSVDGSGNLLITSTGSGNPVITYSLNNAQIFRTVGTGTAVAVTADTTDVRSFIVQDISTPEAAGTVIVTVTLANYPRGTLKPEVLETVSSTISLKFI